MCVSFMNQIPDIDTDFYFLTSLHSQPGVTIQQPGYWAVPPGSNPAGTVTVTHLVHRYRLKYNLRYAK